MSPTNDLTRRPRGALKTRPIRPGNARPRAPWTRIGLVLSVVGLTALSACRTPGPGDPAPPGGGQEYVLDYDLFIDTVAPVLTARGCDTLDCHGGGIRGTYELSPFDDKNPDLDFEQSGLQVDPDTPTESALLLKPLDEAAAGVAHAGGAAFASTDDPDYQALLAWIEAGEFE